MRNLFTILALAVAGVIVLAACRARDETAADSAVSDSASGADSLAAASDAARDTVTSAAAASERDRASSGASSTPRRQAAAKSRDSAVTSRDTIPSQESLRAMRPKLPEVTPDQPREWRGLKLPEERRARAPVEPIHRVDSVPDSVVRGTPRPKDR